MKFSVKQIAEIIDGLIVGDETAILSTFSKIEDGGIGTLTFLSNPKYTHHIYETTATACIVNKNFEPEKPLTTILIKVDDSYAAFAKLLEFYNNLKTSKKGISSKSHICENAILEENCYVGEFAFIGENAHIGANTKIYPQSYIGDNVKIGSNTIINVGVKIYDDCIVGNNCTIHAGTVIGADGFGFAPQQNDEYKKVAQIGNVIIEDNVEIGANTCIDRATIGSTIIRKGVKLDNLIQVAHNVEIEANTVIAAQTGIAGSTKIGKNCVLGGQVGISGHITIADNVKMAAQTGISNSIKNEGEIIMGSPGFEISLYKRAYVYFKKLPEIIKKLEMLEKKINS